MRGIRTFTQALLYIDDKNGGVHRQFHIRVMGTFRGESSTVETHQQPYKGSNFIVSPDVILI
jgi:hypothetical protein